MTSPARDVRRWIPDVLTGIRVLLLPVLLLLMAESGGNGGALQAVGVFAVMALTDALDGFLARRWDLTSIRGSAMDALADRLVHLGPLFLVALSSPAPYPDVPLWVPGGILGVDSALLATWALARARRNAPVPLAHDPVARVGGVTRFSLVLWVLLGGADVGVPVLGAAVLLLALASGIRYVQAWFG